MTIHTPQPIGSLANNHDQSRVGTSSSDPAQEARKPVSNSQLVYQAIVDLANVSKPASRHRISQITGLRMSIVDDHVKSLKRMDKIRLVVNGVFEPVFATSNDRAVSITFTPHGTVKLEVGDNCLDLTLREARAVANGTAGLAMLFGR